MLLINTAANDAKLGRSFNFHIAQCFSEEKKGIQAFGRPYLETFPQPHELLNKGPAVVEEALLEGTPRHRLDNDSDTELQVDAAIESGRFDPAAMKRTRNSGREFELKSEAESTHISPPKKNKSRV